MANNTNKVLDVNCLHITKYKLRVMCGSRVFV